MDRVAYISTEYEPHFHFYARGSKKLGISIARDKDYPVLVLEDSPAAVVAWAEKVIGIAKAHMPEAVR